MALVKEDDPYGALVCAGICALLLYPSAPASASTVFRCEDSKGHITYTLHGCPGQRQQGLQEATTPRPAKARPSPGQDQEAAQQARAKDEQLVVVGTKQDGCSNQLQQQRTARAVIRQQIRSGMTQRDVEEARSASLTRSPTNDGQTRYPLHRRQGQQTPGELQSEYGCVKAKGKR